MARKSLFIESFSYSVVHENVKLMTRDNILITGGASTGLNNVLQRVTWPGYTRRVFMVAPTYYLAANIFRGMSAIG